MRFLLLTLPLLFAFGCASQQAQTRPDTDATATEAACVCDPEMKDCACGEACPGCEGCAHRMDGAMDCENCPHKGEKGCEDCPRMEGMDCPDCPGKDGMDCEDCPMPSPDAPAE